MSGGRRSRPGQSSFSSKQPSSVPVQVVATEPKRDGCPLMVSQELWDSIPEAHRPEVLRRAGQLFIRRVRPADEAVRRAMAVVLPDGPAIAPSSEASREAPTVVDLAQVAATAWAALFPEETHLVGDSEYGRQTIDRLLAYALNPQLAQPSDADNRLTAIARIIRLAGPCPHQADRAVSMVNA